MTKQELTAKLLHNCFVCPYCGTEDISTEGYDSNEQGVLESEVACNECEATWVEQYKLIGGYELEDQ